MKPKKGRRKNKRWLSIFQTGFEHNLPHSSLVYPYRQLLCPTAAITSTKFIQHSIYVDSIENKAIIEKLIIIQIKNNIYICKKNTADQWLGHLTRKKDLLQARRARHTTDHVGLWFAQLSTPRGSDFTAQYFCPDAGNFTGFQVAGVSSALLLWNAKFACRSDFKVLAWTHFRHLRVHRGHNDRPYMKYLP